jgi:hypothetical protein
MTQNEIIEMIREAATGMPGFTPKTKDPTGATLEFYERLTNLAVAKEREACAKVADFVAREMDDTNGTATYIAALIRARGQV